MLSNMANLFRLGCVIAVLVTASAAFSFGQTPPSNRSEPSGSSASNGAAATPAYAELLLRKTEAQSDLESLLVDYNDEYPRVKELRVILAFVDRDLIRLRKVKPADVSRLTLALGKLMLRRIELEIDLWKLQAVYKDEHPDVKRAKKKVAIYESAIAEILG